MALTKIGTDGIKDDTITSDQLQQDSVLSGKIADDAVSTARIQDGAITNAKLNNNSITTAKIADSTSNTDGVTTAKIATGAVTTAKLATDAVTNAKLADQAVTLDKLPHGTSSNDGKFLRANNGADPTFETVSTTPADGSITQAKLNFPVANRNLIINGNMAIAQRSGSSVITIGGGKTITDVDRFGQWTTSAEGSWKSGARVEDAPADFKYSRKITSLGANTVAAGSYHSIRYAIEGLDSAHLNQGLSSAKTVTLSFYVKSSITGTFGLNFTNSANTRSYPTTYSISSANTWEQKTITLTLDTSSTWLHGTGVGLEINWQLAMGSGYISSNLNQWNTGWGFPNTATNAILTTNGATFQLTGVQLELGNVATDFEHEPYATTLAKCQRYYYKHDIQGGIGPYYTQYHSGHKFVHDFFPVTMRATPTATVTIQTNSDGNNPYHIAPNHYKAYLGSSYTDGNTHYITAANYNAEI